jgi:osomolarity two-component system, sensor histidine kinase NIK1
MHFQNIWRPSPRPRRRKTWRELTSIINKLALNLTSQVRSTAKVNKAVALQGLSEQIEVDAKGTSWN